MQLYLDTETYSETPITHGGYRYTADCECMIVTYALGNGPIECWDATQELTIPEDLKAALEDPEVIITCHNSNFDRNVLKQALGYNIPIERWRCTMARAMAHGLPGGLGALSDIFKLGDAAKDKAGRALIFLFCKPNKGVRNTYATHPKEWAQFIDYARSDIAALRRLDSILPKWNSTECELAFWFLDQRRNDRGAFIDVDLAKAALRAVDKAQLALKGRTKDLTEGELESTSKRDATLTYALEAYGVSLPDLQMSTVQRRIDDPDLPIELKELLQIRLQVSTTSTSKYKAMLKAVNDDGRARGLIQFCGAIRTGRDCIAKGSLVNILRGGKTLEVPIEQVLISDLVYDGDNWVAHEGVVFSGNKECIEHDGVIATKEHNVWLDSATCVTLLKAKEKGAKIWNGNT